LLYYCDFAKEFEKLRAFAEIAKYYEVELLEQIAGRYLIQEENDERLMVLEQAKKTLVLLRLVFWCLSTLSQVMHVV
jgi:hypothetical protein